MKKTNKQQKIRTPILAYMGYLFQTFLKRPFGYIIAALYVVYLAVILVIVPACLHFEPLFIWNIGGFNMPIFNLFFIAASAASIAVAVFRTGRDDGSDLNLSAKPITKGVTVGLKTLVYLIIMVVVCSITVIIVALVRPIFGEYNELTNITGIQMSKYTGLLLSVFVGNIVSMLFFGGISVFISMIGGQVITIIGTIAVVFLMCLLNFLYPQMVKSPIEVLSDKYDTEILSYSCNTLHQYNHPEEDLAPLNFAAIQCITTDDYQEEYHYDTYEYWNIVRKESGNQVVNYIDFGKQLSGLYSAFGLDESKLKEASKLMIGANTSYNYNIDKSTWVSASDNLEAQNYPISFYTMKQSQGKFFPQEIIIGANMTLDTSNWYLLSTLWQIEFNSLVYASTSESSMSIPDSLWTKYKKPWSKLSELTLSDQQINAASDLYEKAYELYKDDSSLRFAWAANKTIAHDISGAFFEPEQYDTLPDEDKYKVLTKIHLYWSILAEQNQLNAIKTYCEDEGIEDSFPYKSGTVSQWYETLNDNPGQLYPKTRQEFNNAIFSSGIGIDGTDLLAPTSFTKLVTSKISYAETFANMYQYSVTNFYNLTNIIAIWTVISGALFTGSVIVYKKTDFK